LFHQLKLSSLVHISHPLGKSGTHLVNFERVARFLCQGRGEGHSKTISITCK